MSSMRSYPAKFGGASMMPTILQMWVLESSRLALLYHHSMWSSWRTARPHGRYIHTHPSFQEMMTKKPFNPFQETYLLQSNYKTSLNKKIQNDKDSQRRNEKGIPSGGSFGVFLPTSVYLYLYLLLCAEHTYVLSCRYVFGLPMRLRHVRSQWGKVMFTQYLLILIIGLPT